VHSFRSSNGCNREKRSPYVSLAILNKIDVLLQITKGIVGSCDSLGSERPNICLRVGINNEVRSVMQTL
jgi:hypothetical protein